MKWFKRRKVRTAESVLRDQLVGLMRVGINCEFHVGYAAGILWSWDKAGLPPTAETIALWAMIQARGKMREEEAA